MVFFNSIALLILMESKKTSTNKNTGESIVKDLKNLK